jgi:hypothetical protein
MQAAGYNPVARLDGYLVLVQSSTSKTLGMQISKAVSTLHGCVRGTSRVLQLVPPAAEMWG